MQQHTTTTITTTDQIGPAQHDIAVIATCARAYHFLYNLALTQDCCIVLCYSYLVGGGDGCSFMLLLHPILNSADAGPDLCTLYPDLCTLRLWCFLLWTGANIPLAQVVVVTSCNLRWWCFFIQPLAQIVHLHTWWYHLLQLALVVHFIQPLAQILYLHPG